VFRINEKFKFNKGNLGLNFQEGIRSIKMISISDTENYYFMTKESGELQIIT
jgi:hypothetical protein